MTQEVPPYQRPPNGPETVWGAIADHLAARIAAGEYGPGARLPGERDLGEEYGAALGTIRRAIQDLVQRGLVVVAPGKGTFVTRKD